MHPLLHLYHVCNCIKKQIFIKKRYKICDIIITKYLCNEYILYALNYYNMIFNHVKNMKILR